MTRALLLATLVVSAVARASDPASERDQAMGPVQIIEPSSGTVVLELPAGSHGVTLAVPPGHYLLQRHLGEKTYGRELSVEAGQPKLIDEDGLTLLGRTDLAPAGPIERAARFTSLIPAVITGAVAATALGGGVAFLIWSTRSADMEVTYSTTSDVMFAAGGLAAIGAALLTIIPLSNRPDVTPTVTASRNGAAIAVGGAF
jgi:hypothetical protein